MLSPTYPRLEYLTFVHRAVYAERSESVLQQTLVHGFSVQLLVVPQRKVYYITRCTSIVAVPPYPDRLNNVCGRQRLRTVEQNLGGSI